MQHWPENQEEEDEQLLAQLVSHHPELAEVIALSEDCAELVCNRELENSKAGEQE